MDEGRKRVLGIMAAILAAMHMRTAGDLFGTPSGSPETDKLIAASVQWAERIMQSCGRLIMYFLASEDGRNGRRRRTAELLPVKLYTRTNLLAPLPPQAKRYIDGYYDHYELNQMCGCDHSVTSKNHRYHDAASFRRLANL
jgi:hypothetical protein